METPEEWAHRLVKERNFLSDRLSETQSLLTEIAENADEDHARVLELERQVAGQEREIEELEADRDSWKEQARAAQHDEELNRQTGIIVRQRQTIADLDARVTFLQDKVADLHYQLTEAKDEVTYLKNLHEGEDKSW